MNSKCTTADIVAAGCSQNNTTLAASIAATEDGTGVFPNSVRNQLPSLGALLSFGCQADTANGDPTADVNIACVANNAKVLSKIVAGDLKCAEACEDDYKDKKGNGGPNDLNNCNIATSAEPNYLACLAKPEKTASDAVTKGTLTATGVAINTTVLPGVLSGCQRRHVQQRRPVSLRRQTRELTC